MAVNRPLATFRALLAAHVQTSWNRSAREMGRQGVWVMSLLVGLMGLLGAVPLFLGLGGLGWLLGGGLDKPLAPALLGGALALMGLGGGLFGGVAGGARQLSWEAYRGFPLKLRDLYFAELVAGIGDPLPIILGVGLVSAGRVTARMIGGRTPTAGFLWRASLIALKPDSFCIQSFMFGLACSKGM